VIKHVLTALKETQPNSWKGGLGAKRPLDARTTNPRRLANRSLPLLVSPVAFLAAFLLAMTGLNAQWTATGSGPFRYDDVSNWQGGEINDRITNDPGAEQTIDFTSDRTMPKGLLIQQPADLEQHYGLKFRARDAEDSVGEPRTLIVRGPIVVDFGKTNDAAASFGEDQPINFDFGGSPAVFEKLTGNSHVEIKGSIQNANGLILKGPGGRVTLFGPDLGVTGPVTIEGGWLVLRENAALPEVKDLFLSGRSTIALQYDEGGAIDRLPDMASIVCAGATEIRLTSGGGMISQEVIGKVSLNENCLELWASAGEGGSSVLALTELERRPETLLIVGYETPEAASRVKVSNDAMVVGALVGGGGSQGSTTVSIVPWIRGHGGGNLYSAAGFLTYSSDDGFRELNKDGEYVQDVNASQQADNVRIALGEVALSQSKTVNSLYFDPPADLGTRNGLDLGANTITVTSGAISLTSEGYLSNGTVTTGNERPLIISGPILMDANLSGSGGLIYFGGRYPELKLSGKENTLTGDYVVLQGAIRTGEAENIPDSVTLRLQKNSEFIVDGSETIFGLAGTGHVRFPSSERSTLMLGQAEGSRNRLIVGQGGEIHPGDGSKGRPAAGTLFLWHPDDSKEDGSLEFENGTLFIDLEETGHDAVVLDSETKCANIVGGTLNVNLLNGYQPKVGTRWEIIKGTVPAAGGGFKTIKDATGKGYRFSAKPEGNNWVLELVGKR
jgi:hypothetical protein